VVGFDDTQTATAIWPQLTTVRQPISSMAAEAIELLADSLDRHRAGEDPGPEQSREIRSEIVIRDSSAPPH
jgi:LacI family transcriptional regulator